MDDHDTDLDILPGLDSGNEYLQASETIVQECLPKTSESTVGAFGSMTYESAKVRVRCYEGLRVRPYRRSSPYEAHSAPVRILRPVEASQSALRKT